MDICEFCGKVDPSDNHIKICGNEQRQIREDYLDWLYK